MRPRILVVIKGMGIGGAERLLADGSRFWNHDRFDYRLAYLLPWKDSLVSELSHNGVPVTCFGTSRGLSVRAISRLRALCRESDLIHSHLPLTGVLSRVVSPRSRHVYTEHNLPASYHLITRWCNQLTYGLNAAAVAVSDTVADSIASYPGTHHVIPNGVSRTSLGDQADRVRAELGLARDDLLVVHVGNIRPGKGHDRLIDVASLAVKSDPRLVFVSIGSEKLKGDLARLRSKAQSFGLDGHMRFLGQRPDARNFTAAAAIYVSPSDVEGLPVSVLEAMAMSRPVVATRVGGVPSVVKNGETGYLVDTSDSEGMADRIVELAADPDLRATIGERASELIRGEFSAEGMVADYERLYDRILS